jgi:DNA-binding LacI/PurR family transcriptional regulator
VALCLVNRQTESTVVDEVLSDNEVISAAIAHGLASNGVRKAAYIYGPASGFVSRLRYQGFSDGCVQAGLAPPQKIHCDFTYQGGYDAALELLDQDPDLNAIFAATDSMALGVMDALRYIKGIAIPDDIQVVGFDDEATAGYHCYQLTSVRQPMAAMLDKAVELARDRIKNPKQPKNRVVMKSTIVQRQTAIWE